MNDNILVERYSASERSGISLQLAARRQKASITDCLGFTLVELIVVVGILGVLTALALPAFNIYIKSVKNAGCVADIRAIDKSITAYVIERNTLPTTLDEVGMGSQLDPWKRPFEYQIISVGSGALEDVAGVALNTDYDLYSKGEDGASDIASGNSANADDIVRSNSGIFVGLRP